MYTYYSSVVVIGTPGRLADLLERKDCNLAASVKSLVSEMKTERVIIDCLLVNLNHECSNTCT